MEGEKEERVWKGQRWWDHSWYGQLLVGKKETVASV